MLPSFTQNPTERHKTVGIIYLICAIIEVTNPDQKNQQYFDELKNQNNNDFKNERRKIYVLARLKWTKLFLFVIRN